MADTKPTTPRILQQQPQRGGDQQQHQQQSGTSDFQPKASGEQGQQGQPQGQQQMGEGSYEGSRDYKERTEEYLKKGQVEKDAEAAKPRSEQEAREMEQAEKEGRSHSKGER
jgi:hypothetical protein